VERFLPAWHASVAAQTAPADELWIALDGLTPADVERAVGHTIEATWVPAPPGATPAEVRQRPLARLVERCDAVVFVDADDLLHPTRIEAARRGLADADLTVCGLRLVDEAGADLGTALRPPDEPERVLPRTNVFGLSNTAYRSELLRRCLPLPPGALAVDWYLATRAWLLGAAFDADAELRMDYRQHGANTTVVRPPFDAATLRRDTARVEAHLALATAPLPGARADRVAELEAARAEVAAFRARVVDDRATLDAYVAALDALPWPPRWWSHVARPELRALWAAR